MFFERMCRRHRRNTSVDPLMMSKIADEAINSLPQHRSSESNPEAVASLDAIIGSDEYGTIVGHIDLNRKVSLLPNCFYLAYLHFIVGNDIQSLTFI